jgi:hypothetical protein
MTAVAPLGEAVRWAALPTCTAKAEPVRRQAFSKSRVGTAVETPASGWLDLRELA